MLFLVLQDEPTRWDSTFQMIKRVIRCRDYLNQLSATYKLPDLSYNTLTSICEALDIAAAVTNELSARDATASLILPIFESLRTLGNIDSDDITESVQGLIAKRLKDRMGALESNR